MLILTCRAAGFEAHNETLNLRPNVKLLTSLIPLSTCDTILKNPKKKTLEIQCEIFTEAEEGAPSQTCIQDGGVRSVCLAVSPSVLVSGRRAAVPIPLLFFSARTLQARRWGNRSKAEWMSCFARSASLNGFQGWLSERAGEAERREERAYMCIMYVYANACVRLSPFVPVRLRFAPFASQFFISWQRGPSCTSSRLCA